MALAIIDDNIQLRNITGQQLLKSGFTILFQAGNGQEALQKISEDNSLPEVIIIEEKFEAADLLLEKYPDLKVLICSTKDDEESVCSMLKIGVSGYVLKYADPDELTTAINALKGEKKYFSLGICDIVKNYLKRN